jgi:signal transduction histidine kinase
MNASFKKTLGYFCLFLLNTFWLHAQNKPDFKNINTQYLKGDMPSSEYIKYTDSTLFDFLYTKGKSMNNDSLINMMSIYKKIVTSEKQFVKQRGLYYYYLASNANNQNLGGVMMYYVEKYSEEVGANSSYRLVPLSFKVNYYASVGHHKKILKIYEQEKHYLEQQINSLDKDPSFESSYKTLLDLICLISGAANSEKRIDTSESLLNSTLQLYSKLQKTGKTNKLALVTTNLDINLYKVNIFLLKNTKIDSVKILLNINIAELNKLKAEYPNDYLTYVTSTQGALIRYYKKTNQHQAILSLLETYQHDDDIKSKEKGLAYLNLGNHKAASEMFLETINFHEPQVRQMADQIDDLLNSYMDAKRNKENLTASEKDKKVRLILIIVIAGASVLIIGVLYYKFTSQGRLLKLLNYTTELQISEATQQASKEERKKIGQDLHDGLSGSMAGILYHLEDIKTKTNGSELDTEVSSLYDKLQLVYKELREKSHVNFNALYDSKEDSLDESVQKIVNSALKNNTKREIEIDKKTSVLLDTSTRIEILRIVQEALTNIVKHAKKVTEVFVYLYENEGSVYLEIGNNGVISANKNSDGIGIRSIKSRVSALGGESKIEYEGIGFKIEIKLPKPIHL